jgi:hypothetical protein
MLIQELRWVLLAKPVKNEKSHASVPLKSGRLARYGGP